MTTELEAITQPLPTSKESEMPIQPSATMDVKKYISGSHCGCETRSEDDGIHVDGEEVETICLNSPVETNPNDAADRLEESFNAFISADGAAAIADVRFRYACETLGEVQRLQQAANEARWAHVAEIRRVLGADPHPWEKGKENSDG